MKIKGKKSRSVAGVVLSLILMISAVPGTALAEEDTQVGGFSVSILATATLPPGSTSIDLQNAINVAAPGDIIEISSDMLFTGIVTISAAQAITIRSSATNSWVLNQTSENSRHFNVYGGLILQDIILDNSASVGGGMRVEGTNSALTLNSGTIIRNCVADALGVGAGAGGGIYMTNGASLTMNEGSSIYNNTSTATLGADGGGGIAATLPFGGFAPSIIINGGAIYSNEATDARGGGICFHRATFTMNGGEIYGNTAQAGGGVSVQQSTFIMNEGTIRDNMAVTDGGGIFFDYPALDTFPFSANVINGSITGNSASDGGGIALNKTTINVAVAFSLYGAVIEENRASNTGGGMHLYNSTATTSSSFSFFVQNSSISGNTAASHGGGVYVEGINQTIILAIDPTVISRNVAGSDGGGVYLNDASAQLRATGGSEISDNTALGNGGGIFTGDNAGYVLEGAGYSNIATDSSTIFTGNRAQAAYEPPVPVVTDYPAIQYFNTSLDGLSGVSVIHPINNYDINYLGTLAITFVVTYDPNGGSGSAFTDIPQDPFEDYTVLDSTDPGLNYTRNGYTFIGWNTQSDGSGAAYFAGDTISMLSNFSLYAQWQINSYTIIFDSKGGTSIANQMVEYGGNIVEPDDPTRPDYTFLGWYTDDGTFLNAWDFTSDTVSGNLTLYAKWIEQNAGENGSEGTSGVPGEGSISELSSTTLPQTGISDLFFPLTAIAGILFFIAMFSYRKTLTEKEKPLNY